MDRRAFLQRSATLALAGVPGIAGCAPHPTAAAPSAASLAPAMPRPAMPWYDTPGTIPPIHADLDRISRITVCTRPFRAAGPRTDVEHVGGKVVVHNYGHGGSGWSLSWGAAQLALTSAITALDGQRDVAVIGCGALGLTAALTAQRAGLRVTMYAKERPPFVRSSHATGAWTPDSRIALTAAAGPGFAGQWEAMARTSYSMYQGLLGLPGNPVEWTDRYALDDLPPETRYDGPEFQDSHGFASYSHRIADLGPHYVDIPPEATPFPTKYVRRSSALTFNIAEYSRLLLNDFLVAGGRIETREFHSPQELATLAQRVVINCTGYAARQLWSDESVIPVRGQIAWLIPQDGALYGLFYKGMVVLARRDGIVVQPSPQGEDTGWDDASEVPDRASAEAGVRLLQELYTRMKPVRRG